ncbi:ISAs1 family transposase [Actinoplanes sp. NPDC051411]|uniref:ISAs1 family transposase n=1 Tax=Actinoplanes sp. NPDC051411 TaxID=3155522 RepID=UPI003415695E
MRYPLTALLTVAVCAVLAGASFAAITDWLHDLNEQMQARLGFTRGIPAGTTIWRLLTRLDAAVLTAVLADWLRTRTPASPRPRRYRTVVAVDGKTLRGSRIDGRQIHLLSALDTSTDIVLAQITIDAKNNEIPAFAPLLDAVEAVLGTLTGVLFTADALHTRTGHADEIARRGAHLLVQAKANQPTLFKQLKRLPWAQIPPGTEPATAVTAAARPAPSKPSPSPRPAASPSPTRSRPPGSPQPAPSPVKDVTFREDPYQARTGTGPAVIATLRNTAIGYRRITGATNIARATCHANRRSADLITAVTSSYPQRNGPDQ